ncbi:MAG: ABC transporter permease [Candidatus Doudnabacteria bacterium]|nr:ABC transporter permease [Candidatus Doudnabacteria bacterium]
MRTLRILTWAAIKMFVRNRQALFFTFFFPFFLMTVLGLINFDRPQKMDLGLVLTGPPNPGTEQFVSALKNNPLFDVHEGIESSERQALNDDKRAAVLIIPQDLIPGPSKLTLIKNAGQPQPAATAANIINGMLDKTALQISQASDLFTLDTQEVNSNHLKYIDFLLPGLIALSVMQMSVFSVAFVFVMYKEKGILKRLLATPMKPGVFVLSNVITRLIVTLVQTSIFIILGVTAFHAHVIGSYWLLALIALFGSIMFLGLGFTISGLASTVESVPALANLVVFPMLFLGGTFFAVESFPNWLQHIARYLPLTFFSDAMRQVMTKGAKISQISHDLYWMAGWAVVMIILANLAFSFEEKRQ